MRLGSDAVEWMTMTVGSWRGRVRGSKLWCVVSVSELGRDDHSKRADSLCQKENTSGGLASMGEARLIVVDILYYLCQIAGLLCGSSPERLSSYRKRQSVLNLEGCTLQPPVTVRRAT